MAKKKAAAKPAKNINKSQVIRDYKAANPEAGPKAIADALTAKHGVEFTSAAVSTTLFDAKKRAGKQAAKKTSKAAKPAAGSSAIDAALSFAQEAGGLDAAEQALARLREIKESI